MTCKRCLPSTLTLLFGGLFLAVMAMGARLFSLDGDLGRHLTIGGYILQSHNIPLQDIFSHTLTGHELIPHEWLAQVIFASGSGRFGAGWAAMVAAATIAATFSVAALDARQRRAADAPLLITMLAFGMALLSSIHWLTRPHLFTLLFSALWAWHLENAWQHPQKSRLALTALLMLLWVNLHGAFIVGFVLGGFYLLEAAWLRDKHRLQQVTLHGLAAFGVTFLNPATWRIWKVVYGFLSNRYLVAHTQEYQPPYFQNPAFWPFLLFIGILLFAALRARQRLSLRQAGILSAWALMSLYSARNIPLLAVLSLPILASWISLPKSWLRHEMALQEMGLRPQIGWLALLLALGLFWINTPTARAWYRFPPERFPVAAATWVQAHPPEGAMFNYFDWGGYLLYRLWPEKRVFIDGQTDFYGEALTREYARIITAAADWEPLLAKYHVQWIIIPPDSALASALAQHPDWQQVYADPTAVIYQRK